MTLCALILSLTPAQDQGAWHDLVTLTCVDCHSGDEPAAGIDLRLALESPTEHAETWLAALDAVDARAMPPAEAGGALDADERAVFANGLIAALGVDPNDPGRPTLRRLTRKQLENVLRDLVGVSLDLSRALPPDAAGYGFDTTGDTLFVSPLYFEQWFEVTDLVNERLTNDPDRLTSLAPGEGADVRAAIATFLARAFRRPATEKEIESRVTLFESEVEAGLAREAAFLQVVQSALLSPHFLYRVEREREAESWALDDHELAARLSFFLWGSLPDVALRQAAESGAVGGELRAHVDRMLADPRAGWLASDFAAQWLGFEELAHVTPDVRRFREFNEPLRASMHAEVEGFFADLVANDRSVLECLDSTYAFLDRRLAKHYGLGGVEGLGKQVARVEIADRRRGGLLGMGALLTVTSQPLRTSPVTRGQWLLERLLGSPPPPPPPDAGVLPEDDRQKDGLSLRARLEAHRADPACANCHARMDPYGLALENFDGIGRWREEIRLNDEATEPVDARATLPGGVEVDGPVALKEALLADPERFVRALAEHLFVYAIGRPPTLADRGVIEAAVARSRSEDWRISALVKGIVRAPAFTHRRRAEASLENDDDDGPGR